MAATLTAIDEEDALKRLLAELPVVNETTRSAQIASLRKLVTKGAYRLNYDQLDDAIVKLGSLIQT